MLRLCSLAWFITPFRLLQQPHIISICTVLVQLHIAGTVPIVRAHVNLLIAFIRTVNPMVCSQTLIHHGRFTVVRLAIMRRRVALI